MKHAYNITTLVPIDIQKEWVNWMINIHINQMLETGLTTPPNLYKVRDVDESEGATYTLQIIFKHEEDFQNFRAQHEQKLLKIRLEKWGNACLSFISSMEVIH